MASFWKPEAFGQLVLPDKSILIGQKLVENAKVQKFKFDILVDFQTLWRPVHWSKLFCKNKTFWDDFQTVWITYEKCGGVVHLVLCDMCEVSDWITLMLHFLPLHSV